MTDDRGAIQVQRLALAVRCMARFSERKARYGSAMVDGLLGHAALTVPYFSNLNAGTRPALAAIRPVQRRAIGAAPHHFRSSRFAPSDLVDQRTTSGTSGMPLSVVRDPASFYAFLYETYAHIFRRIPQLRDAARAGTCAVLLANDNPQRDQQVFVNPSLDYALVKRVILGHSDREDLRALEEAMLTDAPLVYGRPRSLVRLAELYRARKTAGPASASLRPLAVLCSGDNLYDNQRSAIEETFQAPVYNAYGSQEGGFIAMECQHRQGMHVLDQSAIVEVLPHGSQLPQADGTGELIVTNLENWAMPFIRYRSGDIGTLSTGKCRCGHAGTTITHIDGRDSVYFVVNGERFNPSVLNPLFERLPIAQFQVVQHELQRFEINWVPFHNSDTQTIQRKIEQVFRAELGNIPFSSQLRDSIGRPGEKVQRYVQKIK